MARLEFAERLADNHEAQIKKTLADLEARIITQIQRSVGPTEILDTRIAIDLRKDIQRFINETYRTQTDSFIRDYDKIVGEFLKEFRDLDLPDKFKSLTQVDLETITRLKNQYFQGFEDLANRYFNEISGNVYQNAIAGKPFEEIVKDISGLISGDVDRVGRSMSTYASQIAHDSVMQFDGSFTILKANESGLKKFRYVGSLVKDSRPFCVKLINSGRSYTKEEIEELHKNRSGEDLKGKAEGDPFIVRGGYRCRHQWRPVADDF